MELSPQTVNELSFQDEVRTSKQCLNDLFSLPMFCLEATAGAETQRE